MKVIATVFFFFLCAISFTNSSRAQQSTLLGYFNESLITPSSFFAMPAKYGTTSGTDTARTIVGYSERFTCPYANTYLDSVTIVMATDSFGPNAYVAVEAVPVVWSGGNSFANFDSVYAIDYVDSVTKKDTAQLYSYTMSHTPMPDTDFFISAITYNPQNMLAFFYADSLMYSTPQTINEERDRSRLLLDTQYKLNYQYYLAGTPHAVAGTTDTLYWYPNFAMIAYVSTPLSSVLELYPAAQDPLSFYVERTQTGETILNFTPDQPADTRLDLFDATGRIVGTLFDGVASSMAYAVPFPQGALANGMYFAKLTSGTTVETRRISMAH